MDNVQLKKKIESLFLETGFQRETLGETQCLVYHNCYCRVSYLSHYNAFVIESADSYQEAINHLFEDGDLYYIDIGEIELLNQIKKDIARYYLV